MPDLLTEPNKTSEPRSQLGLYRAHLTSPEHRRSITVGRDTILADTLEVLRRNVGRKARHHQLFIAPRGGGKTHFLSLIEDEIQRDPALTAAYRVVRFPEEARRVLSFADFLLTICEVLRDTSPTGSAWHALHEKLAMQEDDAVIIDTVVPALRKHYQEHQQVFVLMVENLNQIMEEQIRKEQSIQGLRGFLMQDNGCLLMATSPLHFGALTKADQPFYDFFDTQVLDQLSQDETIALIRRSLEWDKNEALLQQFPSLQPKLRAIYTMTGGSPRLTVMLYELLSTESVTAVKQQFMMLLDRITPFYQDRLSDLSPQERAVIETIASMRDQWGRSALPKTPGNIAKLMRMSQPHVSALLTRLTKSLYLTTSENPADGRSSLYVIREGFFDLWLAMNISRAARLRIPLLTDFFAAFYEQDEYRRQKKEEYWRRLEAGEFDENAAETLSYLSTVGLAEEQASEKFKLITKLTSVGETERPELLKHELKQLPLDTTARWITDRLDEPEFNYLDEMQELIQCWETQRQGGLEAFSQRLQEMAGKLDFQNWSKLRVEFLRDHLETMPLSKGRVEARIRLSAFLRKFAKWDETEKQSVKATSEAETLNDDRLIACACNEHAQLLLETNRLAEAELLMRRSLTITESTLGKDNPNVASSLNNLALVLQKTNRFDEAEMMMRRALAIDEATFGKDHPSVSGDLNNLAILLQDTNRLEEAEPMMIRALAIDEICLGKDHPSVAVGLNNLGGLLRMMNRSPLVQAMLQRSLAIDQAYYGKDHPKVALRLHNLAQVFQDAGRLKEANHMMAEAFRITEASLGRDHPESITIRKNIERLLQKMASADAINKG